jgi:repressor LexA
MAAAALTPKQQQVLDFIQDYDATVGWPPSFRDIAEHFGFRSSNTVAAYVEALVAKGVLEQKPRRARALRAAPAQTHPPIVTIPLLGHIPAGNPKDAVENREGCVLIDVNTVGIKPSARTFALKVRGDSMIEKGIFEGDIVVIEHGVEPRAGDTVAALIDGQVTLKTLMLQRGRPFLKAENPRYPQLIPREELQIQGVMVALIRKRK